MTNSRVAEVVGCNGGTIFKQEFDKALTDLSAEWNSELDFVTRVNNLKDGSGSNDRLNGSYFLQKGITVFDDGVRDYLTGSSGEDWLISFDSDKVDWGRWWDWLRWWYYR